MHIGVDLRCLLSPHRTGVGEYAFELLSNILNQDSENHYYLFYNSLSDTIPKLPPLNNPNVHLLRTRLPNKLFSLVIKLFNYPKLDSLLASHFEIPRLDYFFSPHLNFTALSSGVKHVLTVHDLTYEFFPKFLTLRQRLWHRFTDPRKQCQRAQLVLTPSENTRRDLINYYNLPEEKVKVIYPGLTAPKFKIQNSKFQSPYILFLGTLEPRKNIAGLITAYESAFPKLNTPHDLIIAGAPGWKNFEVKALAGRSALRDRIHFLGFVEAEDKPALYRAASIFVYPSFYEGFGFPVLEAMQNGTPVITSNRSSLSEITNGAAYLVNPHRPNEIAAGLIKILNSPALSERFSILGKAQAAKFSWEKSAQDWLDLLQ